jgi:hypothetical protein
LQHASGRGEMWPLLPIQSALPESLPALPFGRRLSLAG